LFPNGPVKYEAGQLLKLLREHCGADDDAATTTAVAAEVPVAEPAELNAVTTTRNVLPTSVDTSRYVIPVGPATQLPPLVSQRNHRYSARIGSALFHVPVLELNVCPSCAVPEMIGGDTSDGATADVGCVTTLVCADVADLDCLLLDAVTLTRIVDPTSLEVSRYVWAVAPATDTQLLPAESHRCH
jgi:hypothetical protein